MYWQDESHIPSSVLLSLERHKPKTNCTFPRSFLWPCSFASDVSSWLSSFRLKFFMLQGLATYLSWSIIGPFGLLKIESLSSESSSFFLSFPSPAFSFTFTTFVENTVSETTFPTYQASSTCLYTFLFLLSLCLALRPSGKLI